MHSWLAGVLSVGREVVHFMKACSIIWNVFSHDPMMFVFEHGMNNDDAWMDGSIESNA
jgi:hypothetical protein